MSLSYSEEPSPVAAPVSLDAGDGVCPSLGLSLHHRVPGCHCPCPTRDRGLEVQVLQQHTGHGQSLKAAH